jgi:hypothetical protein
MQWLPPRAFCDSRNHVASCNMRGAAERVISEPEAVGLAACSSATCNKVPQWLISSAVSAYKIRNIERLGKYVTSLDALFKPRWRTRMALGRDASLTGLAMQLFFTYMAVVGRSLVLVAS